VTDLIAAVERLKLEPHEVLVIRPRNLLTTSDAAILHRNLDRLAKLLDIDRDRILVLERDVDMTIVEATQEALL
jgi:hypothetical protein